MGFTNGIFTLESWSPATEAAQPNEPDNYVASASAQAGLDEISAGLSLTFLRDGSAVATGTFDMGSNKISNLLDGSLENDAVNKSQLDSVEAAKADIDLQNITSGGYASENVRGAAFVATAQDMANGTNDDKFVTPLKAKNLLAQNGYNPGFIKDFTPVWVDADNISCSGGFARDEENSLDIVDSSTITKNKTITWQVGNAGGLADGAVIGNNTTFYMFALAGGVSAATSGDFTTDDISSNISNFQLISDGYLTYRVDNGSLQTATNLDFTSVSTVNDIANVLNAAITDGLVVAVGNTIKFSSFSTGVSSSFNIFASTDTGTDVYGASYLDGDNGQATQGEDAKAAVVDYGFDTDINATNLMADSNVIAAGLNKYRAIGLFSTDGSANIREFRCSGQYNMLEANYTVGLEYFNAATGLGFINVPTDLPGGAIGKFWISAYSTRVEPKITNKYYNADGSLAGLPIIHWYTAVSGNAWSPSVWEGDLTVKADGSFDVELNRNQNNEFSLTISGYKFLR